MSAIAGIIRFDEAPVDLVAFQRVTDALSARGPDATGHWSGGTVALGHCMLRTTPESLGEQQPLLSPDGDLVLVFDGRLDNREELTRELKARNVIPRDRTDAALVLGAYQAWGEESPKRLLGDFVYAVYDRRQRSLFVARDHVGGRPLYYTQNSNFFAFASHDEPLLEIPGIERQPCEELVAYLLLPAFKDFDEHQSWLRDVRILPAAHTMTALGNGSHELREYWHLQPNNPATFSSEEDCLEAFVEVFSQAVNCRIRSAGPIASLMSGGLDSASIAAMISQLLPMEKAQSFHTYSVVRDDPSGCLETQSIRRISKQLNNRAFEFALPSLSGIVTREDLVEAAWGAAHPVDNSIPLCVLMFLAANRNGDRVLLHGVSGDITTLVPDPYPMFLQREGHWWRAWRECLNASRNNVFYRGSSPFWLLLYSAWSAFAPPGFRRATQRWRNRRNPLAGSVLSPVFCERLHLEERLLAQRSTTRWNSKENLSWQHAQRLQSMFGGIEAGLTGYEHPAGRFGVELRDPWADRRVVEFFLNLPLEYKIQNGWTKYLVREAFEPILGVPVTRRRDKAHLGWTLITQLMSESHSEIERVMSDELHSIEEFADPAALRHRFEAWRKTRNDIDCELVCTIVTLVKWLQRVRS